MQKMKETVKEKLHIGRNRGDRDEVGYTGTDTYGTTGTTDTYGTTGTTGIAGTDTYGTTGTMGTTTGTMGTMGTETYGTTGDVVGERPVGVGTAEVPVVVTEQERMGTEGVHHHRHHEGVHHHHEGHVHERVGEEVCGTKTFTEVEDRPIVKERVERYVEHQPVEKQYVVETKFVGEKAVPSATGATIIGADERVVEVAEPGPKCPIGTGQMMDETIGRRV